ncbi:MAG: large-conductance mechanosensitive channel protein MscL [Clostridia bacterium]|nr:large-conductance mechanosensitive channel protein MscL [Clostridia bacterium]
MKNFAQEFKEFILKGNIIDMAVGVVIGGAFGKIVTSLVDDIIAPLISLLTGKIALADLKWVISPETAEHGETALTYGNFIQSIIDFLIIALCIFIVLKLIMKAEKKIEEAKAKKAEPVEEAAAEPSELDVLKEIRDLLQKEDK